MKDERLSFLRDECLTLSISGALQRSRTYLPSANTQDKEKTKMRNYFRKSLLELSAQYESSIPESEHLRNIQRLATSVSMGFSHLLEGGHLRIGVAQKALNLYLKYLWCLDLIPQPPHCPIDSIILSHIPKYSSLKWTAIDAIEDYAQVVQEAKSIAGLCSLAEWELTKWSIA
jgi:hypothetical protein